MRFWGFALAAICCTNTIYANGLPSDLDGDGDVDRDDFEIVLQSFTGPDLGPPGNPLADLDGDGDVDDADNAIVLSDFSGQQGPASPPRYDLEYNTFTGRLTIVTYGTILNYVLEIDQHPNPPIQENDIYDIAISHNHFVSNPDFGPFRMKLGPSASTSRVLSETVPNLEFAPLSPPDDYNLGKVLPTGMSKNEFMQLFDRHASYVADYGSPITDFNLVYIPEPNSFAMLALGGLSFVCRRR